MMTSFSQTCRNVSFTVFTVLLNLSFITNLESRRVVIGSGSKFIFGGLFPVHSKGFSDEEPCGSILLEKGIQRLEAMLYAIDQINRNSTYWKFSLGAIILDTCSSDAYVTEQSLQFLQSSCDSGLDAMKKVTGVVGAANSAVSESVANIFRLFKIPQVSYASTSEVLDNIHKYPYFFRVVPSDKFQVRVILDILDYFHWTYIAAVASEGDYGENALESLQTLIRDTKNDEICFADVQIIPRDAVKEHYDLAISQLLRHDRARVVIVFLNEDKIRELLTAFGDTNAPLNRFVWLGSDGWGAKIHPVKGNEESAEGAITVLPKRFPIQAGFDDYFLLLKPNSNVRNPWFKEFWEAQFGCFFGGNRSKAKKCTGEEDLADSYRQEGLVPMVIDSVNVLATALRSLCEDHPSICRESNDNHLQIRKLLKDYIYFTHFNSAQGHDMVISFDSSRSVQVSYIIYQFQRKTFDSEEFEYRIIGTWNNNNGTRLTLEEKVIWDGTDEPVTSTCSNECAKGEERISKNMKHRCCWTCRPCEDTYYLPDPRGHCMECPQGKVPSFDKTSCDELELDYLGRRLSSAWALVPFTFSALGLVCTFAAFVIFVLHRKTPLIMASGRELCYVIFIGVTFCFCFTFIALSRPSQFSCGALRTGMGLGLSICFSAIFTKTNRISRIFNRSLRIAKRPSYISPESQLVICLCLVLIQITLSAMWLIIKPPTVKQILLNNPTAWVVVCGIDGMSVLVGLLYNMVLIILCTFYAYKTRNIPENFNESKFISFTMYSSCIIWLAFIPIYCSAWKDYKVQTTVLCMCVSVSGGVTLACLFLPKLYIVLFRPEKNVRNPSSGTNSGATVTYATPTPVRFIRPAKSSPQSTGKSETDESFILANKGVSNLDPNG